MDHGFLGKIRNPSDVHNAQLPIGIGTEFDISKLNPMASYKALLESGIELIHQVLMTKEIPEDLRIKLTEWRSLVEMMIDEEDDNREGEDIVAN